MMAEQDRAGAPGAPGAAAKEATRGQITPIKGPDMGRI